MDKFQELHDTKFITSYLPATPDVPTVVTYHHQTKYSNPMSGTKLLTTRNRLLAGNDYNTVLSQPNKTGTIRPAPSLLEKSQKITRAALTTTSPVSNTTQNVTFHLPATASPSLKRNQHKTDIYKPKPSTNLTTPSSVVHIVHTSELTATTTSHGVNTTALMKTAAASFCQRITLPTS